MDVRTRLAIFALIAAAPACSAATPEVGGVDLVIESPVGAVDKAQNVADRVEQRQAYLETQLDDLFLQP